MLWLYDETLLNPEGGMDCPGLGVLNRQRSSGGGGGGPSIPTYHGSAVNPADNGTLLGPTQAVTPVAGCVAGDLVIIAAHYRGTGVTLTISEASGQSWTALSPAVQTTNTTVRLFWCEFNGTWGADPSATVGAGNNGTTVVMHVFRPSDAAGSWAVDQAVTELDFAVPAEPAPYLATIVGQTTTQPKTVSLAVWATADDNSWGNIAGTDWVVTGAAHYRNLAGNDMSITFAHKIQESAGPTGNVTKEQTAQGPDAGTTAIVTFYEVP